MLTFRPKGVPLKILPVDLPTPPSPAGITTLKLLCMCGGGRQKKAGECLEVLDDGREVELVACTREAPQAHSLEAVMGIFRCAKRI
jgi:hypothetical protein